MFNGREVRLDSFSVYVDRRQEWNLMYVHSSDMELTLSCATIMDISGCEEWLWA